MKNLLIKWKNKRQAENLMDELLTQMLQKATSTEDVEQAIALMMKKELLDKDKKKLDPNVMATILGQVGLTLLILNYEKIGVITSKAFTFIGKRF